MMRVAVALVMLSMPLALAAQSRSRPAPTPAAVPYVSPLQAIPRTEATVHLVRDGERTPYELKSPLTLDGEVTVEIGPGRLSFADLPLTFAPGAKVRILGAGRDSTLLENVNGVAGRYRALRLDGASLVLQGMTLRQPDFDRGIRGVRYDGTAMLVDCTVIGGVSLPANVRTAEFAPGFFLGAVLTSFEGSVVSGQNRVPFFIAYSFRVARDARRQGQATFEPLHDQVYRADTASIEMNEIHLRWRREAKGQQPLDDANIRVIAETSTDLVRQMARMKLPDQRATYITRAVRDALGQAIALGPSRVDEPSRQRLLAQAADSRGRGLRLVEGLALQQAVVASGMRADRELQALLDDNRRSVAASYACYLTQDSTRNAAKSTQPVRQDFALSLVRKELYELSDLFRLDAEPSASCQIKFATVVDFFLFGDRDKQVETKYEWVESEASLRRRARMKEAAEAAAWQAQKARLEALSNSLTNTARELSETRPRLENIGSGTYLVIDRRETRTGPDALDVQRVNDRVDRYNEAVGRYQQSEREMVQQGTRRTTFYRSRHDAAQYELFLTHRDGFTRHLVAPFEEVRESRGPCRTEIREDLGRNFEAPLVAGPCTGFLSWIDYGFRQKYYERYFAELIQEFTVQHHLGAVLREASRKVSSSRDDERLDGMLLAYLVSDNVDVAEVEALAKQVLGLEVKAEELRARVLFF